MFKKKFYIVNLTLASMMIATTSISCSQKANQNHKIDKKNIKTSETQKPKHLKSISSKLTLEKMLEKFKNCEIGEEIPLKDLEIFNPKINSKTKITLAEKVSTKSKLLKVFIILKSGGNTIKQIVNIKPAILANKQKNTINQNNKNQFKKSKNNLKTKLTTQEYIENMANNFAQLINSINKRNVIEIPIVDPLKKILAKNWKIRNKIIKMINYINSQWSNPKTAKDLTNRKVLFASLSLPESDWINMLDNDIKFILKMELVPPNGEYESGGFLIQYIFQKNKTFSKPRSFFIKYMTNKLEDFKMNNQNIIEQPIKVLREAIKSKD